MGSFEISRDMTLLHLRCTIAIHFRSFILFVQKIPQPVVRYKSRWQYTFFSVIHSHFGIHYCVSSRLYLRVIIWLRKSSFLITLFYVLHTQEHTREKWYFQVTSPTWQRVTMYEQTTACNTIHRLNAISQSELKKK